jgi:uncharacterized protein YuzE
MDTTKLNQMKLSFDAKADVLYCSFGEPKEAIAVELENGIVVRLDPDTEEVVGVTVIDFLKRSLVTGAFLLPMGKQHALAAK